ncbi:MAG: hypothetical protein A2992_03400 [Elusimicrobia bacterium RIFCSPLOWO2_01_FULL_59_12]|nr:MAG: hypothetical protein A2992_03400 [Elusimicrobia bacterium RIFCSPLOWO2_01_FULL_59_12]
MPFAIPSALADKVITKDGKVYTGKIMIDGDKAVLIGNPPFDPNSTLIQTEDIKTIVYDEYRQNPPAERRRGGAIGLRLSGNAYSSGELSLKPAGGLELEGSFRPHPVIELGGGFQWVPGVSASGGDFSISASTSPGGPARGYQTFGQTTMSIGGKIYPFFNEKWKTEPYLLAGYAWSRLTPKGSGDSFKGAGWQLGAGAIHPLSRHLFLEGRFGCQNLAYDTVSFLGREAGISPEINQHQYSLSIGLSYRI